MDNEKKGLSKEQSRQMVLDALAQVAEEMGFGDGYL